MLVYEKWRSRPMSRKGGKEATAEQTYRCWMMQGSGIARNAEGDSQADQCGN